MSTRPPSESVGLENVSIVDWKVLAARIETEGSIDATFDFKPNPWTRKRWVRIVRAILIAHGERAPLDALQEFLLWKGIYSKLRLVGPSKTALGKKPHWRLEIQRAEDVEKVLDSIKCYLLTERTKKRVNFYLRTRHMNYHELRAAFLQDWIVSGENKQRRERKGQPHVY